MTANERTLLALARKLIGDLQHRVRCSHKNTDDGLVRFTWDFSHAD